MACPMSVLQFLSLKISSEGYIPMEHLDSNETVFSNNKMYHWFPSHSHLTNSTCKLATVTILGSLGEYI